MEGDPNEAGKRFPRAHSERETIVNDEREAERALVQAHGTWKLLPLHPQPQWLESWSSYLIRLAEANGLKSINELATLAGLRGRWKGVRASPHSYFVSSSHPL